MKYCINCGHKQENNFAKFCSSCGEPLSSNSVSRLKKTGSKSNIIGDDETDATEVPSIDKIQVDVEMPSNVVEISNEGGRLTFKRSKFSKRTLELND